MWRFKSVSMQILPTGGPARMPCYVREGLRSREKRAYSRAQVDTLAFALTGCQRFQQQKYDVHPVADRTLTVLEAKRLQVCSHCFTWPQGCEHATRPRCSAYAFCSRAVRSLPTCGGAACWRMDFVPSGLIAISGRAQDFPDSHVMLAVPKARSFTSTSASLAREFAAVVVVPTKAPTAREAASAMQRLANDFRLQQWTLAGNAVPVNVARHLGRAWRNRLWLLSLPHVSHETDSLTGRPTCVAPCCESYVKPSSCLSLVRRAHGRVMETLLL